ncbi:MAG: HNH endonuclease [Phormidesmis sp. RL_2_1]|nr:HNH endonuclease [Phormidesmis sp. RL_2_1]
MFDRIRSASSKNQRTNEYLTLLAQSYEGKKLARQFSKQRSWLTKSFEASRDKEQFVRKMSDVALYSKHFIYSGSSAAISSTIADAVGQDIYQSQDGQEAVLCLLYLIDAKHKMAHTILSRFYAIARNSSSASGKRDFLASCKSIAAFFTLWRSALARKYPDSEYRKILQDEMCWSEDRYFTISELNKRLRTVLEDQGISVKGDWIDKASQNLRYSTSKALCKFVLFISSQDTIPDPDKLGLMTVGNQNSTLNYLGSSQWTSNNLETIEHVAPQERTTDWDLNIYEDESYDKIGNLTLLPSKVNTSASNKGWIEKYIYYRYLSEANPSNTENLRQVAIDNGVTLSESTMQLLGQSSFNHHILPIVQLGENGIWDKGFIEERSYRICEIVWDRLYSWLE